MKRRLLPLAAAVVAVALSLSGCGANQGGDSVTKSGWDVNEQPRDKVQDGGTFHGAFGSEIKTWNLSTAVGNDYEMRLMQSALFENWIFEDGVGNHTNNPNYISELKEEVKDGKLVLTMSINPKAVWNDGAPITVKDWQRTVEVMSGTDDDYSIASSDGWDKIESVEQGKTAQDVVFTFKETFPDWQTLFIGSPLRAESAVDADTFNDGWSTYKKEWYSGPYIVTDFESSSNTVTMERNPNWWGDKGKLDKIIWKYVSTDQWPTAFANGELDYIDIGQDANAYAQVQNTPGAQIRRSSGPNYRHFTVNSKSGVLSDVNIRQAIVMGLDRAAITASDLAGLDVDTNLSQKNSNLYMQDQAGYTDWAEKTGIKFDQAGAKKKLEEAGYTMGSDGYYAKDGQTLTVRFAVLTGVPTSEGEGQLILAQMKEIGVKIELQNLNTATDWPGVLTDHKFDIIGFSWMGTAFPLANINQLFGATSDSNYAQLDTPLVDELTPKIAAEMDPAARQKLAQQVDEALWKNVHTIPLYQRPALAGVKANLANFGSFGLAQTPKTWVNVGYVAE
ncbi:MAG: ABC transporter family substrate-binding protein [Propionibacteriaceae bacterium]|jgi:peptide/nickel transport system substrate-binding protein|nr:ABC transporter family substrate-binding protein [Propionibacteriaceae bacterium]